MCRNNRPAVNEKGAKLEWRVPIPEACTDGTIAEPDKTLDCRPVPHMRSTPATAKHIAVFHYLTKSRAEFAAKVERGGGAGNHRTWREFEKYQKCVVPDFAQSALTHLHCFL